MHGAWCWAAVIDELAGRGIAATAIDLPGHGTRADEAVTASMVTYAAAVIEALESLGRPAVLVGHSMSGQVVARAATARPELIARLMLLNGQVLRDGETNLGTLPSELQEHYRELTAANDGISYRLPDDEIYRRWLQDLPRTDPRVQRALSLVTPQPFAPLVEPAIDQDFPSCGVTAVYLRSTDDVGAPVARAERFVAGLPVGTRVAWLPGGHDAMISQPEAVASHLADEAVAVGMELVT
jgi:pimeloyl-ACP methyl ester carboxylesterase